MDKFVTATSESVLRFLRLANGMSQRNLARATGLSEEAIASFESGSRLLSMGAVHLLAAFFSVSCEALLNNTFPDVVAVFTEPITAHLGRASKEPLIQIGDSGEAWVAEQERRRLAGTPYTNAVNPGYAREVSAHFDVMSFKKNGTPLRVEVKSTPKDENTSFYMTDKELRFVEECLYNKWEYELHRVYHLYDPKRCSCRIYSAREVLELFHRTPCSFTMQRKAVAA